MGGELIFKKNPLWIQGGPMKKCMIFLFIVILGITLAPPMGAAVEINPVISTAWLQENINNPSLAVIDIRKPAA
jgi:hypothetical protein